jgi:chaperonin GroEL (HSP60 family)
VVRVALENASSIAAIFLTTECIISEQLKTEQNESNAISR